MRTSTLLTTALAIAITPFASAANVVAHDKVKRFTESTGGERDGALHLRFKPWLEVESGCVPYPAVDKDGGVSGGLKNSGAMNGGCTSSDGQVYSRSRDYSGMLAIMYSWYMPKDQNVDGPGNLGHRHDWENVIVWLSGRDNPQVKGISYSGHGGYTVVQGKRDGTWSGDRPRVAYYAEFPLNHSLGQSSTQGGEQALISWNALTQAARDTLNTYDFGKANVPFKDANFGSNLEKGKL